MSTDTPSDDGRGRLWAVPAVLLAAVSGLVLALALAHPAKPEAAKAGSGPVALGDAARGRTVFASTCAGCHGANAEGGAGPRLAGASLTAAQARTAIEGGRGIMTAGLVHGQDEQDVLAYLATIFEGS